MKTYKFIKRGADWYIDLPEYLAQGGSIGDLQMVDGADKMLDTMAKKEDSIALSISTDAFDGADQLILTEKCDPYIGGGYHIMKTYRGQELNRSMWLCQVTNFIFGELPQQIFVRKES